MRRCTTRCVNHVTVRTRRSLRARFPRMSDGPERSDSDEPSIAELAERLARDSSRLAAHEAALSASQHVPEAAVAAASAEQIADAVVPFAGNMGEELLEEAEEVLDEVADTVPGAGAIGQVVDIVLFPGRLGLRIATTVIRGGSPDGRTRSNEER